MRVLIVDDHVLFQEGLTQLIGSQPDMSVVGCACLVQESITKALELKPDVILMDFSLPDGTGLDASRQILAQRPSTQIVFLTVHEEDDRLFEAIRYGAKGYLLKNIPAAQLLGYLRGLARGEPAISPIQTASILREFSQSAARLEPPDIVGKLTSRQREVLQELRNGATNQEIAQRLFLSEQTVKNHVSRLLNQLNLESRYEAADFARRYNI